MDPRYDVIIGLEVHVQLLTRTKLFCGCATRFGARPNTQVCPVCLGLPGALPVMNRRAFELALRAAEALHCRIAEFTKWDRKNYYYPDLPKNYQISQYDLPFAVDGHVEFATAGGVKRVGLIRVHLEEDAGKNLHADGGGDSLVDLNRAGTPLLEIVSQPDLRQPADARLYLETLRTLLRDLEISDCEMQEGSLRCDANINLHIRRDGNCHKTPIVEIKNMNSMRMVEKALWFEMQRQYELWEETGQELGAAPKQTRGWDDIAGVTRPQREKEEASDYRYFPEPDLVPVMVDADWLQAARGGGELSADRKARYQRELGLSEYNASVIVDQGKGTIDYFEALRAEHIDPKSAANWIINDLLAHAVGRIRTIEDLPVPPTQFAELIRLVQAKQLNLNDAREKVLPAMIEQRQPAGELAQAMGLEVVADPSAIETLVEEVIAEMDKVVADVRAGKQKALGALVGAVMKKSKGKFPPAVVNEVLSRKLGL